MSQWGQWHVALHHGLIDGVEGRPVKITTNHQTPNRVPLKGTRIKAEWKTRHDRQLNWINLQSKSNAHLNICRRSPLLHVSHTVVTPPAYTVPKATTMSTDKNIRIICNVSVHTTALNPPCKIKWSLVRNGVGVKGQRKVMVYQYGVENAHGAHNNSNLVNSNSSH